MLINKLDNKFEVSLSRYSSQKGGAELPILPSWLSLIENKSELSNYFNINSQVIKIIKKIISHLT